MTKTCYVEKVGSHHWSWTAFDYRHDRVYPTKREALMALQTYMDERDAGFVTYSCDEQQESR